MNTLFDPKPILIPKRQKPNELKKYKFLSNFKEISKNIENERAIMSNYIINIEA
jgi:hypothetical protein